MNKKVIFIFSAVIAVIAVIGISLIFLSAPDNTEDPIASSQGLPDEIVIDYALWNYLGLVVKEHKLLEDEFKNDGVKIKWVRSLSGGEAVNYLMTGSVDFAAAAATAALISFINGSPITSIYTVQDVLNSLMVAPGSDINSVEELKGKKVALIPGTNPYIAFNKALISAGLSLNDVESVTLQYPDGMNELLRGRVDAWGGSHPLDIEAEREGARFLYKGYPAPNLLHVRSEFAEKYPHVVQRVVNVHEAARQWAVNNPDEYVSLVSKATNFSPDILTRTLETVSINEFYITDDHIQFMLDLEPILRSLGIINEDYDFKSAVNDLVDRSFVQELDKNRDTLANGR